MKKRKIKIVAISDTHRQHWKMNIPDGDILFFCGDAELDTMESLIDFNEWLGTLNFRYRVVIFGNHDFIGQKLAMEEKKLFLSNAIYLENTSCQIEGIHIWGSPYSPIFNDWAYMKNSRQLQQIWDLIPEKTDVVLSHCPPFGILDNTPFSKWPCGCPALLQRIEEIKPAYHCFGHIHNGSSILKKKDTTFINCSLLDDYYNYVNEPKVFYYEK